MLIETGHRKYLSIKSHAFWNNVHLDSRLRLNEDAIVDAREHLKDCIKTPTIGLIARKETRPRIYYPVHYERNLKKLNEFPEVQNLQEIFRTKLTKLYPKTKNIRRKLIESQRIVLEGIKPKMTKVQKLIFKLK